jgi:beta-glucosidase
MLALIALALLGTAARAEETSPPHCGKGFTVTGPIKHFKKPAGLVVQGTDDPEAFAEEIYGKSFVASVDGLPAGRYTVQIDLAETFEKMSGQRIMRITCGKQVLADDLDIFQAAGGYARAYRLTAQVDHAADDIDGPLAIAFTAKVENAKLNAIHILDADGKAVACVKAKFLSDLPPGATKIPDVKDPPIYMDATLPLEQREDDLIRRMSLAEKVGQLMNSAPAIERLNVPAYNYWNECLHGVARAGHATVFPQAIGMAAMWDVPLMHTIGDIIATEGRAKYYDAIRHNNHGAYFGLDFWTPNINIFRDPRWGRGQETYGEDTFLTSRIAVAFITGLQGDDPHYFKALACAKHYAVHSGPESTRHVADIEPSERDLYETYLPHFEAAVREAHVGSVMGAYNCVYGEPCCSNPLLLQTLLRDTWGFQGHVVSDCGAIDDIYVGHKIVKTAEQAAARALKAGCDLNCGDTYGSLARAVMDHLVADADLNTALRRVLRARFMLGMFDPPERVPFSNIPLSENDSPAHGAISLQAARESIVLLKNSGILPLDKSKLKKIAVLGGNADSVRMLLGNYNGDPSQPVTILQGIKNEIGTAAEVVYAESCPLALHPGEAVDMNAPAITNALTVASAADVVIYVGGINATLEGEQMSVNFDGFNGGDRTRIELPEVQTEFLKALYKTGKPIVYINCSGSAIAMPWQAEHLPAIVQAWYPGQAGGTAVADVLFGNYNPSGRLPVTFYRSTKDLPEFENYSMANRTYRYFTGKPLFSFGHGLSYTKFKYFPVGPSKLNPIDLAVTPIHPADDIRFSLNIENAGDRDGQEVVQVYARQLKPTIPQPIHALVAFQRIALAAGVKGDISFSIPAQRLRYWDTDKKEYTIAPGEYELQIGASSTDIRTTVKLIMAP